MIAQFHQKGIIYLQEELKRFDETYYHQVDINNPQRIMRALEVCIHTGKPFSAQRTKIKKERSFNSIPILINLEREKLYQRIYQSPFFFAKSILISY